MEHEQFEILIAAVLTAGVVGASGRNDPATVAQMLVSMAGAVRETELISKRGAAFIPKLGR
jgi:hypothetical protein